MHAPSRVAVCVFVFVFVLFNGSLKHVMGYLLYSLRFLKHALSYTQPKVILVESLRFRRGTWQHVSPNSRDGVPASSGQTACTMLGQFAQDASMRAQFASCQSNHI